MHEVGKYPVPMQPGSVISITTYEVVVGQLDLEVRSPE